LYSYKERKVTIKLTGSYGPLEVNDRFDLRHNFVRINSDNSFGSKIDSFNVPFNFSTPLLLKSTTLKFVHVTTYNQLLCHYLAIRVNHNEILIMNDYE